MSRFDKGVFSLDCLFCHSALDAESRVSLKKGVQCIDCALFGRESFWIPAFQAVAETAFCHPEFISGSHNLLILLDAETSSA